MKAATWLAIAAMLPTLGIGIWVSGKLLHDFRSYTSLKILDRWVWSQVFLPGIGWTASWFIPLLLGYMVALLALRRRKPTLGLVLGTATIVASYLLLAWKLARDIHACSQSQPMCGESWFFADALYAAMCLANLLGLAGFISLLRQRSLTRGSNTKPAHPVEAEP